MNEAVLDELKRNVDKTLQVVADDMATIRTSRAKPDLISGIDVMAYGQKMKLFELASVAAPDANLLVVTPWDKSVIKDVERAIMASPLSLNPNVSGDQIKIAIPQLTEERRLDFVKLLHQKMESGKVMIRQVRQEIKEKIDHLKGTSGVSEDDIDRMMEILQKTMEEYVGKLETMGKKKEEEIMAI